MNRQSPADIVAAICALIVLLGIGLFAYMEWKWAHDNRHLCSMNPAIRFRGTDAECEQYLKATGALE